MQATKSMRIIFMTAPLAAILLLGGTAVAQSTQIQGVINGRSGPTMSRLRAPETWSSSSHPTRKRKTYRAYFMLARSRWA
jgi:hypothetical protein